MIVFDIKIKIFVRGIILLWIFLEEESVLKSLNMSLSFFVILLLFFQIPDLLSNEQPAKKIKVKKIIKNFILNLILFQTTSSAKFLSFELGQLIY